MTDHIDRQAAIDALARTAREKFNLSDEFNHYLAGLMDGEIAIRQLPSVEVEPVKRGKWLYDGFDGYNMLGEEFRWKKCSLCGYSYSTALSKSHNYCPNCGADMRGDEVEPVKRGRWEPHPSEREWDICSYCHLGTKRREYGLNDDGTEWVTEQSYTHCPWCGAKMENEDGNENI